MRALILVMHQQHDRRAQGLTKFGTRVDGHLVGLLAGRGEIGLAGPAAGELFLDIGLDQGHPRRAAVDDGADAFAVRFTEGGDGVEGAEGAGHWGLLGGRWRIRNFILTED